MESGLWEEVRIFMTNRFLGDAAAAGLGPHSENHSPTASFQNPSGGDWWLAGNSTLVLAPPPPWVPFVLILTLHWLVFSPSAVLSNHCHPQAMASPDPCPNSSPSLLHLLTFLPFSEAPTTSHSPQRLPKPAHTLLFFSSQFCALQQVSLVFGLICGFFPLQLDCKLLVGRASAQRRS